MENVCARIITGCVSFRTRTPDVLFLADLPSIRNRIKLRNATIFETVKRLGHEAAAYKTTNVDPPPPSRRGKAPEAPASWRTVALESVEAPASLITGCRFTLTKSYLRPTEPDYATEFAFF